MAQVTVLIAVLAACLLALQAHSQPLSMDLKQPFQRGSWQSFGSAIFSPKQAILTTQLAPAGVAQRGALWNQNPFPYKSQWEILLRIKVSGRGNDGEGLALWLTEQRNELGPVFGSRDYFKGLGIMFDSNDNDKLRNNPSISAHYFDGTKAYDHSDDGLRSQLAGCIADYRNRKNTVAAKIAYNGTHLSVHVDLTETGEYRKCIVEKLTMTNTAPLYLGVSAETNNGPSQETQDIISIEVKGTPDWSRPAPPQVNADQSWQQQYQAPVPPQQQQQWQAPQPPAQDQWQAPPAAAPASSSSWAAADSEAAAVHTKLDQLMKAAEHTQLESASFAEALKELETNLMRHVSGATKAIMARIAKLEPMAQTMAQVIKQVEKMSALVESNKASVDAGRVDAERRANELLTMVTQLVNEVKPIRDSMEKNSRASLSLIERRLRDSSFSVSQAVQKASTGYGMWIYICVFQMLFVVFLLYRHVTNKKLDKLL